MKYSVHPSPIGSSDAGAAQVGSQVTETIDVEDDDTIQPINSNARANARSIARSIAPSYARSDRRLNWSNEEDIRLVSALLHNSIDPIDGNDKKADQYWSDVTSTYNSTTKGEPEAISAIGEKLDKFIDATTKAEKIAEVQQSLASKKPEVAKEQTKSKMLDLYRDLLCAPTSELSEEAKAERSKALELMASTIFPKDN
ncbi:unnamed protein product [Urochloa decumbens]|uniref:Uncharacterized protein n=1 Tax=Urochloa decumbens TaxID=240449 RepID=A0ABC9BAG8_9POAL